MSYNLHYITQDYIFTQTVKSRLYDFGTKRAEINSKLAEKSSQKGTCENGFMCYPVKNLN